MKKPGLVSFIAGIVTLFGCTAEKVQWVSTTYEQPWVVQDATTLTNTPVDAVVNIDPSATLQTVEGFGSCFNELGWTSLSRLSDEDMSVIFQELFSPEGANFTLARMPVAANDFSLDYYSYDDVDGDFELSHFTIDHDKTTLIPFINAALEVNPSLKIWASPWCPPAWMKVNKHYANASTAPMIRHFAERAKRLGQLPDDVRATGGSTFGFNPLNVSDNGLSEENQIQEGTDAFNLQPEYLDAYARYFGKFIDAYKQEGIDIYMVMPQNEPNSAQWYPACTWTPEGLSRFVSYLGPEIEKRGVDLFLGTIERADPEMWDRIIMDPDAGKYIKGLGFQWAGKDALPELHKRHPELPCYQTEQECGNGRNDWSGAMHSWDLMKHYFRNGVQGYLYWNTSLLEGGVSTWGWSQNSLVTVNKDDVTYRFTPEYYILKHASHYVMPGSKLLSLSGTYTDALAFVNPDGEVIVLSANQTDEPKSVSFRIAANKIKTAVLPANSLNTFVF